MAFDEHLAECIRHSLRGYLGISEQRMFGGICFLMNGNMLCGVHQGGGMARVGKDNEAAALAMDGVSTFEFTGRKLGGIVDVHGSVIEDTLRWEALLELAVEFVGPLPKKKAKRKHK